MKYHEEILKEFSSIEDILGPGGVNLEVTKRNKEREEFTFAKNSLYLMTKENKLRKFCVLIIKSNWFEAIIITLIILNSLFLGIFDYENPKEASVRNKIVNYAEPFFTISFTIEAILKIIAMGFIKGEGTYLKDYWNWVDFIVVVTSWLSIVPAMANVSAIRTFRLFRPLRSFSSLPALKAIISTLIGSLTKLGEIMIVAFLFFYIFSILGLSLWVGENHFRCYETPEPINGNWTVIETDTRSCGYRTCPVGY